jgi:hypothetical protein
VFSWLNQSGLPPAPEDASFNRLVLNQVNRSQAGEYMCVLTSRATGGTASSSVLVTVQCKWGCMVMVHGRRIQLWLSRINCLHEVHGLKGIASQADAWSVRNFILESQATFIKVLLLTRIPPLPPFIS